MVKDFEKLVEAFAFHVKKQTQEMWDGRASIANKHARKVLDAFLKLRAHGNPGRDALAVLFSHPDMDVRTTAAAFLLRYRTAEAKAVLQEAAKGQGLIPFEASEALKRWEEGVWALDLVDDAAGPATTRSHSSAGLVENLKSLAEDFAYHTEAQTHEMLHGSVTIGNGHAKKSYEIVKKLNSYGDAGRDALAVLLAHPSMDVRTAAATFLLRYRTAESKAVLEEAAKGKGLIPFEASLVLKSWEDGTWNFDMGDASSSQSKPDEPSSSSTPARSRPSTKSVRSKGESGGRKTGIERLVAEFAASTAAQTDATWKGDSRTGNKHVRRYSAAFKKLIAYGDAGRDALAVLFVHPRMDVRVSAAAYLLRYRTVDARAILEEAARGTGMVPFEASLVLKNWDEGTWALDPIEKDPE